MAMNTGAMRERVAVQRPYDTRNPVGETIENWYTVETRWASVESLSAREVLRASQQQTEISHRVRMRYVPGINSRWRLVWRNRALQIVSLVDYRKRSELEIVCLEDTSVTPVTVAAPPPPPQPQPDLALILTEENEYLIAETGEYLVAE